VSLRRVCYPPKFDEDAALLGGVGLVQRAIAPLVDVLERNPEIFAILDIDTGIYYSIISGSVEWPALVVTFVLDDDGDVIMSSVDRRR